MKTDKLFYRIFLNQPDLIAELIPGIPSDCEFEYSAPVLKEKETRLDGLLTPISNNSDVPLIFLEAQMQRDTKFYSRYFRGIFSYIDQYEISKNWHGLLILLNKRLELGSELPHRNLLNSQVERLYLEDLLHQDDLSPNLALLRLIVTPKDQAGLAARKILNSVSTEAEFQLKLDLVESILVNKFTQLTLEEIQKMLNLKEADITQTRFYQEVLEIGEKKGLQQGVQQGEANLTIRLLKRRCGNLTAIQEQKVRSLSISQLESLGEALLDFQNMSDLENWLPEKLGLKPRPSRTAFY
jgi:predicted transposase/invertase (TIGR01784 family)